MKSIQLNKDYLIVLDWKNRRSGFKHEATLLKNGYAMEFAKALYCNRTWECFEYQSVILSLINNSEVLTKRQKTIYNKRFKFKTSSKPSWWWYRDIT